MTAEIREIAMGPSRGSDFFALTTIGCNDDMGNRRYRTVGIFHYRGDAQEILKQNYGDLDENCWYL